MRWIEQVLLMMTLFRIVYSAHRNHTGSEVSSKIELRNQYSDIKEAKDDYIT
jgi:hypothetical protein